MGWAGTPRPQAGIERSCCLKEFGHQASDHLPLSHDGHTEGAGGVTNDAYLTAEARARVEIDRQLTACGWAVQDRKDMNLYAAQGVAVREFIMAQGHGRADYLLFVDQKAVGAVEAKPVRHPAHRGRAAVREVRDRAAGQPSGARLAVAVPRTSRRATRRCSPMASTPSPARRPLLTFHRPESLARWLRQWTRGCGRRVVAGSASNG